MRRFGILIGCGLALTSTGCVSHTRPESASLPQPWPRSPNLADYEKGDSDDPSVGGDILKDYTPAQLAAERAAATATPPKPNEH